MKAKKKTVKKSPTKSIKKETAMKTDETPKEETTSRRLTVEEIAPEEPGSGVIETKDTETETDVVNTEDEVKSDTSTPVTSFSLVGQESDATSSEPMNSDPLTTPKSTETPPLTTSMNSSSSEPLDLTSSVESMTSDPSAPAQMPTDTSTDSSGDWLSSSSSSSGTMSKPKGSKMKFIIIFFVLAAVFGAVGGGIYYYTQNVSDDTTQPSLSGPSPQPQVVSPTATPTPTSEPVDYSELSLEILNGSGTPGEAGKIEDLLTDLEFVSVDTGNAESYDYEETEIALKETVSETAFNEIKALLSGSYTVVRGENLSEDYEYDIQIIVGSTQAEVEEAETSPTPTEDE